MAWFYCPIVGVALKGNRFWYLPLDGKIWLRIYWVKIIVFGRHSPVCLVNINEQIKSFSHLGVTFAVNSSWQVPWYVFCLEPAVLLEHNGAIPATVGD